MSTARSRTRCGNEAEKATTEKWMPIPDAPGYQVSDQGRVRSVDRVVHYRDGRKRTYRGCLLQPATNPDSGYHHVCLSGRDCNIHCLVLTAFVGPRPPRMVGRHLNGQPDDNRLGNLAWGTYSENEHDKVAHGTHHLAARERCLRGHRLVAPNLMPSVLRKGHRACLACDRAKSTVRKARINHGVALDLLTVAAAKYAEIMRGEI